MAGIAHRVTSRTVVAVLASVFVVVAGWVVLGETLPGDRWALMRLDGLVGSSIDEPMVAIGDVTDTLALSIVVVVVSGALVLLASRARLRVVPGRNRCRARRESGSEGGL